MPNRESSARISHVLGNYEIFDEIGRGGMGIVYRALDLSLDRPVAVKILRDDLRMQSMIVSRFAREARAAASLDHPNIVQIYSVGESHRTPYIAMELVDSEPLSALLIRERRLPWERAFAIAGQVAAALASAHDAQIIHRDVKPPNILLAPGDKAYVTDFGIAKILSMHDQLTLDGTKLGTPQYMSPERCKTGDASASSDLYSLGVLLFQMISGRLPHEGATATELIKRILSQPPSRLRAFVPDVPEDVERMVAWLIEERPEDRPASAVVALEAMDRVRSGQRLDTRSSAVSRALSDFRGDSRKWKRSTSAPKRGKGAAHSRRSIPMRRPWLAVTVAALAAIIFGWCAGALIRGDSVVAPDGQHEVSNWYAPANAASFLREAENMWIAHLTNPGLRIRNVVWGEADQSFLLLTDGGGEDDSNIRRAVLAVDPRAQFARAAAPRLGDAGGFIDFDWGTGDGAGFVGFDSGIAVASSGVASGVSPDARWIRGAVAGVVGESRLGNVVRCAFHPVDSRALLVVRTSGGEETIFENGLGEVGVPIASVQSVEMIAYSGDGARYFYTLRDPDGLLSAYGGDTAGYAAPMLVWRGDGDVRADGIRPDGSSMVVLGGDGEITDVSLTGPSSEESIGEGTEAVWIDSGRLAVIAGDTRGVMQIWEVSRNDDAARHQLSFLAGGVEGPLAVSSDGRWIAAIRGASGRAAVMLVQLVDD